MPSYYNRRILRLRCARIARAMPFFKAKFVLPISIYECEFGEFVAIETIKSKWKRIFCVAQESKVVQEISANFNAILFLANCRTHKYLCGARQNYSARRHNTIDSKKKNQMLCLASHFVVFDSKLRLTFALAE